MSKYGKNGKGEKNVQETFKRQIKCDVKIKINIRFELKRKKTTNNLI